MLVPLLALLLTTAPSSVPESECLSANGRTACGYACRSTGRDAKCAQTPFGLCTVLQGEVHCFDPPAVVIHHPPRSTETPMCRQSGASVACGYNCNVTEGRVTCARTPYGVCSMQNGRQVCWDPSEETIHQYGASLPTPQCRAAGGSRYRSRKPAGRMRKPAPRLSAPLPPRAADRRRSRRARPPLPVSRASISALQPRAASISASIAASIGLGPRLR